MVRDERFCHIFSFILNHKALSFSFVFQSWTLLFLTISAMCDFGFCVDVNMCISLFILFITTKQDWEHFKITGHWMLFHKLFLAITSPGQTVLCRYQNKTFLKTCSISTHSLYLLCTQVFHNRGKNHLELVTPPGQILPPSAQGMEPRAKSQAGLGSTLGDAVGLAKLNDVLLVSAKYSPAAGKDYNSWLLSSTVNYFSLYLLPSDLTWLFSIGRGWVCSRLSGHYFYPAEAEMGSQENNQSFKTV